MKNIRSYVCALFLAGFYAADAGLWCTPILLHGMPIL